MDSTHIVELGGLLSTKCLLSTEEYVADTAPVVAFTMHINGVPMIRLVPETLLPAEKAIAEQFDTAHVTTPHVSHPIAYSRPQAIGFPAWPIMTDPANAQHALNLVADIEWARKNAKSNTGKVWSRFQELTEHLRVSAPHFAPTLLEELARIFDDSGVPTYATRAFGKAREIERTYGLPVDDDRHRQAFMEFARRGIISGKNMGMEATSCMTRFDVPKEAYQYFFKLNVNSIRAGNSPYSGLPKDLVRIAKPTGRTATQVGLELLNATYEFSGLQCANLAFMKVLAKQMKGILSDRPDIVATAFSSPELGNRTWNSDSSPVESWVNAIIDLGGITALDTDPAQFRRWLLGVLEAISKHRGYDDNSNLIDIIYSHKDMISGLVLDDAYGELPLEIMEVLTIVGVTWQFNKPPRRATFQLYDFFHYASSRNRNCSLHHLSQNPQLRSRILHGWSLEYVLKRSMEFPTVDLGMLLDELFRNEYQRITTASLQAVERFITVLTAAAKITISRTSLEYLCTCAESLSPAHLLATNLNHGLITELVWPELERHIKGFQATLNPNKHTGPKLHFTESYPGVVAFHGGNENKSGKVIVVAGEQTLFEKQFDPPYVPFDMIAVPDVTGTIHVLALCHSKDNKVVAAWDDGHEVALTIGDQGNYFRYYVPDARRSSLPLPTGGRLVGEDILQPHQDTFRRTEDIVYGDNNHTMWWSTEEREGDQRCTIITQYNPAIGDATLETPPTTVTQLANAADLKPWWEFTTFLPTTTSNTVLPTTPNGEICCIVCFTYGTHYSIADSDIRYAIVTGDGTVYTHDTHVEGVVTFGGITRLIDNYASLHIPNLPACFGTLEPTRDMRGEEHWMYQIPYAIWVNFRIRDEAASQRLRTLTAHDVAPLLEALVPDGTEPGATTANKNVGASVNRSYTAVSVNCLPGSAAMVGAAQLLGTNDHELCVSVVQHALAVQRMSKKLTKASNVVKLAHKRAETQTNTATETAVIEAAETTPVVSKTTVSDHIHKLTAIMAGTSQPTGKKRDHPSPWLTFVGQEKALVAWAMAPISTPATRREAAALLRALADANITKHTWRQVLIANPNKLTDLRYGSIVPLEDSRALLLNVMRNEVMIGKVGKHRLLTEGPNFPEEIRNNSTFGAAKTAHGLGVEPGMDAVEMREWADRLDAVDDIDPLTWKAEKQPLIDALVARTFLTETAATMLLAGGTYTMLRSNIGVKTDQHTEAIFLERRNKQLKLTKKNRDVAEKLLDHISFTDRELLMTAAFDNNTKLLEAFITTLPASQLQIPEHLVAKYLTDYVPGPWAENSDLVFMRILKPLGTNPQFPHTRGYGRAAAILLDLATNLPANDAHRGFIADQLSALKTVRYEFTEQHQQVPLTGDLTELMQAKDIWWQREPDGLRALQEGCFDQLIDDLRDTADKPAGCQYDPRVTAPHVVERISQDMGLSEGAATYFLQLLALVAPTDTNVKAWNNWKKKDLDAARAELIAQELVVEGKRTRAGRSVFLPGDWWEAPAQYQPVEPWKSQFYLIRYFGKAECTVPWYPPTRPLHRLFALVWEHWRSGDRPSFEELNSKEY